MARFVMGRVLTTIPLLLVVSLLVFLMIHLIPGSAAAVVLAEAASPENVAALEAEMGLDDPLHVQYARWISGALQGNLGESLLDGRLVTAKILERLPVTFSLAAGGMLFSVSLGLLAGIAAGISPGSLLDRLAIILASVGFAVPNFWLALLLATWFAVELGWFPAVGYTPLNESLVGWLRSMVLPWLALSLGPASLIARQMRSSLRSVLQTPYIRAARAAGVGGARLIVGHALPNALIPVVTVIGFQMNLIVGGAFVIEQVFALPGMGTLVINAVFERDVPVVQGAILFIACLVVCINLLVDMSYGWLNPKVRLA
jgi:peptide/nickel transport system permease protein